MAQKAFSIRDRSLDAEFFEERLPIDCTYSEFPQNTHLETAACAVWKCSHDRRVTVSSTSDNARVHPDLLNAPTRKHFGGRCHSEIEEFTQMKLPPVLSAPQLLDTRQRSSNNKFIRSRSKHGRLSESSRNKRVWKCKLIVDRFSNSSSAFVEADILRAQWAFDVRPNGEHQVAQADSGNHRRPTWADGRPKERRRITRRHPGDALLFIIIRFSILPSLLQLHHAPRWVLRTEHLVVNDVEGGDVDDADSGGGGDNHNNL